MLLSTLLTHEEMPVSIALNKEDKKVFAKATLYLGSHRAAATNYSARLLPPVRTRHHNGIGEEVQEAEVGRPADASSNWRERKSALHCSVQRRSRSAKRSSSEGGGVGASVGGLTFG